MHEMYETPRDHLLLRAALGGPRRPGWGAGHPGRRHGRREAEARQAEEVAVDLVRSASALFTWAFETRYTDPDPADVAAAAAALEEHAGTLRGLDTGQLR
jgi:hypothetical protein